MAKRREKPTSKENWTGDGGAARLLADSIQDYWLDRGFYSIRVWTVERTRALPGGRIGTDYDIRSNLVDGLPPGVSP